MQLPRALVLVVVACGGSSASTDPPGPDAPAPDPQSATNLRVTQQHATELALAWDAATTASYKLSYATGTTAPATCTPGPQTIDLSAVTTTTVSGLAPTTSYAFRLCTVVDGAIDAGITATGDTLAPPPGEVGSVQISQLGS